MTRAHDRAGSTGFPFVQGALFVAAALFAGGCAGAAHTRADKPFTFTVAFEKKGERLCPAQVTMAESERNCGLFFPAKDCVKVKGGQAYKVRFAPSPADAPAFEVRFDPFRDEFKGKKGPFEYTVDPKAPLKTYSFNVLADGCDLLDPRIILD